MSKNNQKMQPWQFWKVANRFFTPAGVARVFNKEKRSAYSWAQDPMFTEHRCACPIVLLGRLFEMMNEVGLGYACRALLRYLEGKLDDIEQEDVILQPLPTMQEEQLADYKCLAAFQQAIDDGLPLGEVHRLKRLADEEIERTMAKYVEENDGCA